MGRTVTWIDTSREVARVWYDLCPPNEYRLVAPASLPSILPGALLKKADSVLVAGSVTPHGDIYYMANIHRIDGRVGAIDQEPFGIGFVANSPTASGCLIHHGTWANRTVVPPVEFWTAAHESGFGRCTPFSEAPRVSAGPLSALRVTSQRGAFDATIDRMRRFVEEERAKLDSADKALQPKQAVEPNGQREAAGGGPRG